MFLDTEYPYTSCIVLYKSLLPLVLIISFSSFIRVKQISGCDSAILSITREDSASSELRLLRNFNLAGVL
jgi:hypothetical protein